MTTLWLPATVDEVGKLVERELRACTPEMAALFAMIRVPIRAVSIMRSGAIEHVFVIAEQDGVVVYYEDVEDGFNVSRLAADGSIATPGHEQWRLQEALCRFEAERSGR